MWGLKARLDQQSKILFRNSGWVFFSNFYSTALALLRSVIIARGLGPQIFGTYAIIVAFVGVVQEFLNLNTGTAIIRFGAVYHNQQETDKLMAMVKRSLYISLLMAALSVLIIALVSFLSYSFIIDRPGLEWFIILYAVAAGITYVNSISKGLLRLYYKFKMSSIIQMIMDTVETLAIAIAIFFYPKNLDIFFTAIIITRFLNGFICNALAYYELRKYLAPHLSAPHSLIKDQVRPFRDFVLGNSIGNSLKTIISQGDVLLLGFLSTAQQVGFYSVAKRIAYSVLTLTDPLTQSIYPQLSKLLAEGKYRDLKKMLFKISSIAILPSIAFLIISFFLNEWIITFIYGDEYLPAASSFYFFLMGAVIATVTFWALPLVQSLGMVRMRIKAYTATIIIGSFLAWLFIPSMQAAGMALALLITNIFNVIIFVWEASRRINRGIVHEIKIEKATG